MANKKNTGKKNTGKKPKKKESKGIVSAIISLIFSPMRIILGMITELLKSINKLVVAILNAVVGTIIKIIVTIVSATLLVFRWIASAIIRLFGVINDVIRGMQDKLINFVTTRAGHITPENITKNIDKVIIYGGVEKTSSQIIGTTTIYAFIFAIFSSVVAYTLNFSEILIFASFIGGFILVYVIVYVMLNMFAERRADAVDAVLPDVLQIVSVNLIAGMTPYNSLLVAARPEFGPLAEEIHKVVRDTLSGKTLAQALEDMTTRVRSNTLKRCIKLMIQGMESGGELSKVLQETARDIRYIKNLQKEMKANTTAYSMFILFAVLIGAPLLLGVSITFVEIFSAIFETIDVGSMEGAAAQASMISLEGLSIDPDFFWMYAVLVLIISGFFGGIMIGVIQSGKASSGLTMAPILAIIAVVIFVILHRVLFGVFGGAIAAG